MDSIFYEFRRKCRRKAVGGRDFFWGGVCLDALSLGGVWGSYKCSSLLPKMCKSWEKGRVGRGARRDGAGSSNVLSCSFLPSSFGGGTEKGSCTGEAAASNNCTTPVAKI